MTELEEMIAAWLPPRQREALHRCGVPFPEITEIRLRDRAPMSVTWGIAGKNTVCPGGTCGGEELRGILSRVCGGSVHAYDEPLRRGYLSPGGCTGIRVGAAGRVIAEQGRLLRLQRVGMLCIRVPHEIPVSGGDALRLIRTGTTEQVTGDVPPPAAPRVLPTLFYAPPGGGKTTLLRHIIRSVSRCGGEDEPLRTAVIDTAEELYTDGFSDCIADFFSAYPRGEGIMTAVRAFSPQLIVCDEIGNEEEADAMLRAQAGGVPMIATAHADSLASLLRRPCFARLYENGVFAQYVRVYPKPGGFGFRKEVLPC